MSFDKFSFSRSDAEQTTFISRL